MVVSAHTGEGIQELLEKISSSIPRPGIQLEVLIPYNRGDLIAKLHQSESEILESEHLEEGTRMIVKVRDSLAAELETFNLHG